MGKSQYEKYSFWQYAQIGYLFFVMILLNLGIDSYSF
nr:MAG TPA: hypothetical protein [Caudoviricetes sp.]DAK17631.1 MAG TPA: hypothetical protein [Caudoviricetes sp.]DAT78738.1 MAG TPA: hypothetical protein [Caudoviricetes sp.]